MPPRRHLTETEAVAALERGRGIEQLLGLGSVDGRGTIRWLTIWRSRDEGFVLSLEEVFAAGPDFLDIAELEPVDGEEGGRIATASTAAAALELAVTRCGARRDRWVNEGLVGDEYADAARAAAG